MREMEEDGEEMRKEGNLSMAAKSRRSFLLGEREAGN